MKKIISVMLVAALVLSFAACGTKGKDTTDESNSSDVTADVNSSELSSDDTSNTEQFEEVTVVDEKGNPILNENGEPVTKKISVTPSPDNKVPKEEPPTAPQVPNNPATPTPPTEALTVPPTEPVTEPPTEAPISYGIDYFVEYAKSYGQSIGLKLYDENPQTGSWDMPITGKFPITEQKKVDYKIDEIEGYCKRIQRESKSGFWVYSELRENGSYYLYIGY